MKRGQQKWPEVGFKPQRGKTLVAKTEEILVESPSGAQCGLLCRASKQKSLRDETWSAKMA